MAAKTLIIQGLPVPKNGVLGGPVALAALQATPEYLALNVIKGTQDPAGAAPKEAGGSQIVDLSTGALDGSQVFQGNSESKEEKDPSLLEKNEKAIKAVAKLATESAETPKKAPSRYFIQPAAGKNWGAIHGNNGVDIANSCGTPVVAAADGTVVNDPNFGSGSSGWNSGFGKFVLLKHPNGTKTRYAHLSKIFVAVGEVVEQGQQIGKIGNTGKVEGRTGCHVHFEVLGGRNPFGYK